METENREFICMEETVKDTQKKIRTWSSTGYDVWIVSQNIRYHVNDVTMVVTSLWRAKK